MHKIYYQTYILLSKTHVYYCNIQTQLMFTKKNLQLKAFKEASLPSIAMTTLRRFLALATAMVIEVVCSQLKLQNLHFV